MKQKSYPVFPDQIQASLDIDGGFLCFWTYWRPDPDDDDPEMPGLKQQVFTYIPTLSHEPCLCGSKNVYGRCCRPQRFWQTICPNLAWQGYSFLESQTAVYHGVDGRRVRERLMDEIQLQCVEDTSRRAFWILWGDPALKSEYGVMCFGDIELQDNRTLIVTAMSRSRMAALSRILKKLMGEQLPQPDMDYDPVRVIDKQTGKHYALPVDTHKEPFSIKHGREKFNRKT